MKKGLEWLAAWREAVSLLARACVYAGENECDRVLRQVFVAFHRRLEPLWRAEFERLASKESAGPLLEEIERCIRAYDVTRNRAGDWRQTARAWREGRCTCPHPVIDHQTTGCSALILGPSGNAADGRRCPCVWNASFDEEEPTRAPYEKPELRRHGPTPPESEAVKLLDEIAKAIGPAAYDYSDEQVRRGGYDGQPTRTAYERLPGIVASLVDRSKQLSEISAVSEKGQPR